jgi:hypothetical protein
MPSGTWRESERSPKEVRSFASSVCMAIWRRVLRTVSPGGAIVRFLSVYGTLENGSTNDRPRRCDRSLLQCATSHCE